jgi:hypothetical protein
LTWCEAGRSVTTKRKMKRWVIPLSDGTVAPQMTTGHLLATRCRSPFSRDTGRHRERRIGIGGSGGSIRSGGTISARANARGPARRKAHPPVTVSQSAMISSRASQVRASRCHDCHGRRKVPQRHAVMAWRDHGGAGGVVLRWRWKGAVYRRLRWVAETSRY